MGDWGVCFFLFLQKVFPEEAEGSCGVAEELESLQTGEIAKTGPMLHKLLYNSEFTAVIMLSFSLALALTYFQSTDLLLCFHSCSEQLQHGFDRLKSKIRSRKMQQQFQRQREAALTIQNQACTVETVD